MIHQTVFEAYVISMFLIITSHAYGIGETTTRPNTLLDDADDIQRQLDNEAWDRMKFGKPQTLWILHLPVSSTKAYTRNFVQKGYRRLSNLNTNIKNPSKPKKDWSYLDQTEWSKKFPDCGRNSQSPVNLPPNGLIKVKGYRKLSFKNYNAVPKSLTLTNDGNRVIMYGQWEACHLPLIYGGAAHSRKYVFNSMIFHWPSEHRIGGVQYPLESQVIHISAEYQSLEDAISASSRDSLAIFGIINLYKYKNHTQKGLAKLLRVVHDHQKRNVSITRLPLSTFNPPMKKYACYHGSLTAPPCSEAVVWVMRANTLQVTQKDMQVVYKLLEKNERNNSSIRQLQPLNERKLYYFNEEY